jgi:hypothetical protein
VAITKSAFAGESKVFSPQTKVILILRRCADGLIG